MKIAGDFNKMKLGTLCNRFDLRKIVKKPTRQTNILHQVMTNMSPRFQDVQHLPSLGRSDHQCLLLNPEHRTSTRPITKTYRPMKRSNLIEKAKTKQDCLGCSIRSRRRR